MRNLFLGIFWLVVTLTATGAAVWHLAFRSGNDMPERVRAELAGTADIVWIDNRDAVINLDSREDVETLLGVAHGLGRPWLMALYRQAALGRLAEWFGPAAVELDLHVRALGIPEGAVPPSIRETMEAYARGVRAAQERAGWEMLPALVGSGIQIEPWTAAHSLAVERLLAWLSASIGPHDHPVTLELTRQRNQLAAALGLSELPRSTVWTTRRHGLFARLHAGDSGIPPYMVVSIRQDGEATYEGATVPGLPYRICGRSQTASWCKPFTGDVIVRDDSLIAPREFFAIEVSDGSRRAGERAPTGSRLLWDGAAVSWPGISGHSDAEAWLSLPRIEQPFRMATLGGIRVDQNGLAPLGASPLVVGSATVLGEAPEISLLAHRIDAVDDTTSSGRWLLNDAGSALSDSLTFAPDLLDRESARYLRNWDGRFQASSIAASLFDLASAYGALRAADSLTAWYGNGRSVWRWETDPALVLEYPGRQLAGLPQRYGPVSVVRTGHPTAPSWGPSRAWPSTGETWTPSIAWEAHLGAGRPMEVVYRRPDVPYHAFLGRYRSSPVRADLLSLVERQVTGRTRVFPED